MIQLIDQKNEKTLQSMQIKSPFDVKIKGLYDAYGLSSGFLDFYRVQNEQGEIKGILSKLSGLITVTLFDEKYLSEMITFAKFFDCEIEMQGSNTEQMGQCYLGAVFLFDKGSEAGLNVTDHVKIEDAYDLLSKANSSAVSLPEREAYYVDMSHRIRHNAAKIYGIYDEKTLVATAVIVAMAGGYSLISGFTVLESHREKGFGGAFIRSVYHEEKKENRKMFVLCREELERFYERNGARKINTYIRTEK